MKHILTLTDFSEVAEDAVRSAFRFASDNNARLTIYHRLHKSDTVQINPENRTSIVSMDREATPRSRYLDKWYAIAKEHKVKLDYVLGQGSLVKDIRTIAENRNIDLIIMGSKGAAGKKEYLWGSHAERVIENVDCPVLVLKKPMKDYRLDNIVFASSFDEKDKPVFQFFLDFIKPPTDSVIHLLLVNTLSYFSQPTILVKEAMADFEELAKPFNVQSHFYPDYSVDAGIRHFLKEVDPDILVMSNKYNKPLKHALSGSETIRAVNHTDFPILSVDYK